MWQSLRLGAIELWQRMSRDSVGDFAASLAFRLLLALFPFAVFLAATGAFAARVFRIEDPTSRMLQLFGDALPADARSVLEGQLQSVLETQSGGLLSIGVLGAIWAASAGMAAAIRAMNHAYDVEEARPFWRQKLVALALTVGTAVLFITAFALVVAGGALTRALAGVLGLGDAFEYAFRAAQLVLVVGGLLGAVGLLYWLGPAGRRPMRWISAGAVVFVLGWLGASIAFSQYVARFGSYEATYGALGGVVVLMLWLYITSYLLLVGAELNGMLAAHERARAAESPPDRTPVDGSTTPGLAAVARATDAPHGDEHDARGEQGGRGPRDEAQQRSPRSRLGQLTGAFMAGGTFARAGRSPRSDGRRDGDGAPAPGAASRDGQDR